MASIFNQLELSLIRSRVRSGVANAKAKGKQIGRKSPGTVLLDFFPIVEELSSRHMEESNRTVPDDSIHCITLFINCWKLSTWSYLTTPLDREANSFLAQSILAFSIGRRFRLSIVPFVSATK